MPKGNTSRPYTKNEKKTAKNPFKKQLTLEQSKLKESKRKLGATLEKNKVERDQIYKDLKIKKLKDSIFPK